MRFAYLFLSFHVVHFVTSFLSLQLFFPVRLVLPFLSTRPFPCIRPFVAPFPFHSLLPFDSKLPSRSFDSSFRVKWFISFHHSFRFNSYIPCHCRLEKTRVAASGFFFEFQLPRVLQQRLQFLIQALFAFLLETPENMHEIVWGLHNIPFIGSRGRHTSPGPQTHHPADTYLWGVSQLALGVCAKLLLTTRSFWKVVEEGKEQTDAYGCHAINAQYNVRTARLAVLQCTSCLRTTHRVGHEFAETLPAASIGGTHGDPILYMFESTLLCLVWSRIRLRGAIRLQHEIRLRGASRLRGEFVFGIRLREAIRLRRKIRLGVRNPTSGRNSSSGKEFIFGEFVFGIRLREVIRLLGAIRLQSLSSGSNSSSGTYSPSGNSSSSGGHSSSGNSSSEFVFGK